MCHSTKPSSFFNWIITLGLLLGFLFIAGVASAHQTITVGDYAVEYGWLSEPAVVGQPNAIVINLTSTISPTTTEIDTSALTVSAVFGPETKTLTLQPLGENTPGQYIAPITPMLPGSYTVHLGGNIGSTAFSTDVQPEEVKTADVVQFPAASAAMSTSSTSSLGLPGALGIAGVILGTAGLVFGLIAFSRKPAQK